MLRSVNFKFQVKKIKCSCIRHCIEAPKEASCYIRGIISFLAVEGKPC